MNKKLLSIACLMGTFSINAQVGIGTTIPNKSAELAVVSDYRGLLIPNITLKSLTDGTTIQAGNIESLLVYNTNNTDQLSIGYYYWHNNVWNKLIVEKDIPEIVVNYFEEITQGGDVTNIIKNIVRNTEGNVLYENGKFYYINSNGDKIEIDFSNIQINETVTILNYDAITGLMTYANEKGQVITVDIKTSVKTFETLTKIVQDLDKGTITFYDEKGGSTVLLIADFVQRNETETTLVRNKPGNYSYTNEKNVVSEITVIGDIVDVINNKLDQMLYQTLKTFVDIEETVTKLEYNASTKMLIYTDEDKQSHSINISQIIKENQDITRIDGSNSRNITVTSELNGNVLTYVLAVNTATASDLGVVKPGSGLNVDQFGVLSVDVTTILSGKQLSGNDKIVVTNGAGSVLKEVFLDINEGALNLQNIGGVLNLNQIYSGTSGDILFVDAKGKVVWSALKSITSNQLILNQSDITSNVNGVLSTVSLVDKISNEMIQSRSVTEGKLGAIESQKSMVPVVQSDGSVKYQKINEDQIEGKLLESANNLLSVSAGAGAILKDVILRVNQSNFELNKIGGKLNISQITTGQNNTVLITNNNGNVEWVDHNTLIPTTSNALLLENNKLTSTVNNISSSVDLNETNVVSSKGITGTGITVDGGVGASLKDVSLKITPGGEEQVLITRNESTQWVDHNTLIPTTSNALLLENNKLTSTVNNISSSVDLNETNVVSSKGITGTGITVDGGVGASLKDVSLKITPGGEEQVLITRNESTQWVDHNALIPTTVNMIERTENMLTSTVNNVGSTTSIIGEVKNILTGTKLVTEVNGVQSVSVDLQDAIGLRQNTSAVTAGVNTTVTSLTIGKHTDYSVNVSKTAIQEAQKLTKVVQGNGIAISNTVVDDTTTYVVAVDPSTNLLTGNVTGPLTSNKVVAIQNVNVSTINPLNNQVLTYNQASQEWIPATPQINTGDILNGEALTSTDLDLSSNASTALLKTVTANIKTGAVTSDKILDGTILPIDIANAGPSEVLSTSDTGVPQWSKQKALVQDNQKISHVVEGQNVNVVESYLDNTTTYTINVKSALPKFFYMPSVLIPTAEGQSTQNGVTFNNATRQGMINLYDIYNEQFNTPVVSSRPGVVLPVINIADLDFIITYIDNNVFFNLQLTEQGLLTYEVRPTVNVTNGSFMNIVFSIR